MPPRAAGASKPDGDDDRAGEDERGINEFGGGEFFGEKQPASEGDADGHEHLPERAFAGGEIAEGAGHCELAEAGGEADGKEEDPAQRRERGRAEAGCDAA